MNCQSFENVVVDLARSMPLEASVRDDAFAHVACCDRCGRRLAQEKLLTVGLQALASETKSAIAPDYVQQNLIAAFQQQKLAPQTGQSRHAWRYLAIAAAIVVAAALGIAGYRMRQASLVDHQVRATPPVLIAPPVIPTPAVKEPSTAAVEQEPPSLVAKKQSKRRARPAASAQSTFVTVVVGSVTDQEPSEVVSTFMAVGYTNPANIQEGAQVVRVELPRYAMARFGLPVNMERYDERVKADVWLGTDGVARAIRFVQ
jgi:hypothetical protein